jgi:hypothetical protein
VWDSDAGISYASGNVPTEIINNIIGPLTQMTYHFAIGSSQAVAQSRVAGNLLTSEPRIRLGGSGVVGCPNRETCFKDDPQVVEAGRNFRLLAGSPAIDVGVTSDAYDAFARLYGFRLTVDVYGTPRPQGPRYDIGAAEFSRGAPPPPRRPRAVK